MSIAWPWRRQARRVFSLAPRWKEELVVTGPGGSFVLAFWMGIPTIDLPPEDRWRDIAPAWAAGLWHELKAELEDWCRDNSASLQIDPKAHVW